MSLRPTIPCNTDGIPDALRVWPHWVVWKLLPPEKEGDKPRKIPFTPRTGKPASAGEPDTWGTFAEAVRAYQSGLYAGIGFEFHDTDPFIGGDIDECRNPETGEIDARALDFIRQADTYTEFSQSGEGVKFIGMGKKISDNACKRGGFEMYDHARFFALTGNRLPGTPPEPQERQEAFAELYRAWFGTPGEAKSKTAAQPIERRVCRDEDMDVLSAALQSKKGPRLQKLLSGDLSDYDDDESDADLGFCSIMAFFCGPNGQSTLDALFRSTPLYRPKWDEIHSGDGRTYGEMTISRAYQNRTDFYNPIRTVKWKPKSESTPRAIPDVEQELRTHLDEATPKALPIEETETLTKSQDNASEPPKHVDEQVETLSENPDIPPETTADVPLTTADLIPLPDKSDATDSICDLLHRADLRLQRMGVTVLPAGLMLPPDMDDEDRRKVGLLLKFGENYLRAWANFRWGDWYNSLPKAHGVRGRILGDLFSIRALGAVIDRAQIRRKQQEISEWALIARRVAPEKRRLNRCWSFWEALAALPPDRQDFWLAQPSEEGTVGKIRAEANRTPAVVQQERPQAAGTGDSNTTATATPTSPEVAPPTVNTIQGRHFAADTVSVTHELSISPLVAETLTARAQEEHLTVDAYLRRLLHLEITEAEPTPEPELSLYDQGIIGEARHYVMRETQPEEQAKKEKQAIRIEAARERAERIVSRQVTPDMPLPQEPPPNPDVPPIRTEKPPGRNFYAEWLARQQVAVPPDTSS